MKRLCVGNIYWLLLPLASVLITIKHPFLDRPYARMVWSIILYATGLTPPRSIGYMFNSWLSNVGVGAVCWTIWRCRNNIIFNKIKVNSILQVIFRERTGYISGRSYSVMSKPRTHSPWRAKILSWLLWSCPMEGGSIYIVCYSSFVRLRDCSCSFCVLANSVIIGCVRLRS